MTTEQKARFNELRTKLQTKDDPEYPGKWVYKVALPPNPELFEFKWLRALRYGNKRAAEYRKALSHFWPSYKVVE